MISTHETITNVSKGSFLSHWSLSFDMWWFIYALAICSAWSCNYVQNESIFKKTFVSSNVWPPSVYISKVSSLHRIYHTNIPFQCMPVCLVLSVWYQILSVWSQCVTVNLFHDKRNSIQHKMLCFMEFYSICKRWKSKIDRRNSGGTLRQKFNLINIWLLIFDMWHLTYDILHSTNGPMD